MKTKYSLVRVRASRRHFIPSILAAAVAFALATNHAEAQTILWNTTPVNNVVSGAWGTATNWVGSNIPDTNLEIASLSRDWTGTAPTFALGADRTINGLIYEDTGASADLVGTIVAGSTLTFGGTTPTITTPNSFVINSIVNWGASGLTKAGPFGLTLTGNNTGTGVITLSAGTLRATTSANALGTGTASLLLSGASTVLQLANDTALNFARNTTVSAATTITSDRIAAGAGVTHTLGTLSIGAQTLTVTRGSNATSGTGGITFGATTISGAANFAPGGSAQLTLGAISGGVNALTKSGAGTLVLGSANIYNGGTNPDAGQITVSNATALGNGSVTWTSGDTGGVAFTGGISYANNFVVGTGVAGGVGQGLFRHTGGGGVANLNGTVTLSGLTGSGGVILGSNTVGQELRFNGPINQIGSNIGLSQRDGRTIFAGGGDLTGNFVISGTALAGATNGIPQGLVAQIGASLSATLDLNGFNQNLTGLTFGAVSQAHSGTVNLGANTLSLSQGITVAAGTTPTHTVNGTGSIDLGSTVKTVDIADTATAVDLTINSPIIGSGGFSKTGLGTLVINNSVQGPVSVSAGALMGLGTLTNGLSLTTGSSVGAGTPTEAGTLTMSTLSLAGTTTLLANVGANGTDLLNVSSSGGLTQSGTTNVVVSANGGIDSASTFYPLISYVGTSPGLSGFTLGTLPGRVTGTLTDTGTQIGVTVANDRIIWTGAAANGNWDVNTTTNWKKSSDSSGTNFLTQDDVLFNDDGIAQNTIALTGTIDPVRVEFADTTGTYTVASGTLSGSGLMKFSVTGGGTVVLKNANTYPGPTVVTGNSTLEIDHTSGTMTATNGVLVDSGSSLRLTKENVSDFTFNRNISGAGSVVIDPNKAGTATARGVTISGVNNDFSGTWDIDPSGTYLANGTVRALFGSQANLGTGSVIVRDGGQFWANGGVTFTSNLKLTGAGYQETGGGTPTAAATGADGSSPAVPAFAYGGIGAVRMNNNGVLTGNITLDGDAKIMPHNATGTISGNITNTASGDDLVVGGGSAGSNLILTGDNSGLERIWVNGGGTTGTNQLIVGNNTTTGSLGTGDVILYQDAAAATLRFQRTDGYTLASGQNIIAAHNGTATNLTKAAVQVNTLGTGFTIGSNTIDLSNGTDGGTINVGNVVNGSVFNIGAGATIETGYFGLGEATGISASVNQTGGTVAINGIASNASNNLRVGHWGTNTSIYNFSGGTLSFNAGAPAATPSGGAELGGGIYVGVDGQGIFNQSGGTVSTNWVVLDNRGDSGVGANMATGIDQYNLSSGTLELKSIYGIIGRNLSTAVNLSGGTIRNTAADTTDVAINSVINSTAATTTTLDTVNATRKFTLMNDITGTGTITTTGGGLIEIEPDSKVTRTGTSDGLGTQTISSVLDGTSAFTKLGSGTTTLSAANTYSGATTVSAGRLNLTGSLANSDLTAATGATLGGEGSAKTISFGSGTTNLFIDGSTAGALTSTGTLTVGGTVTVDFSVPPPSTGSVLVLTHAGTTATASNFALANPANFRAATFTVTGTEVTLDVNKKSLVWDGTTATWEIGGTENDWNDTANDNFFAGDAVTFDETYIAAAQTVTMTGALVPSDIIVNNSTHKYTITGSGIGGVTGLTKSGTAALDLGGANTFTGPIAINGGVVTMLSTGALGANTANITIASGGALDLGNLAANAINLGARVVTIAGDGAGTGAITHSGANDQQNAFNKVTLSANASIGGTKRFDIRGTTSVLDLAGFTLTKQGSGLIYATVDGTVTSGDIAVNAGTLGLWNGTVLGTGNIQSNTGGILDVSSTAAGKFNRQVTLNGGQLTNTSASTIGGNVIYTAASTITNAADMILSGAITEVGGPFDLVKTGAGSLVLSGSNALTGKVNVSTGILRVGSDALLGAVPGAPVADAITLQSGGRIQGGTTAGNDLTIDANRGVTLASGDGGFHAWSGFTINYAGAITGAGNLTKTDGGIFNYTGTSNHTGTTIANGGTFNLNGATLSSTSIVRGLTGTLNINSGTTITTGRLITSDASGAISVINQSGGAINITGSVSSNDNTASVLLGHWGSGAQTTYNLSGGTLPATGATMSFGYDAASTNLNQTGGTVNTLGINFANGHNGAAAYTLNGGRLNLGASGMNAHTGKVFSAGGGTLGAFANWTSTQPITLNGVNGSLTVNNTDSVDNTTPRDIAMSAVLSGPGGLIKTGAGKLTLSATNTFAGNTIVNEGILDLTGGGGANGTIRGTVTVNASGILRLSTNDATGWDSTVPRLTSINLVGGSMDVNTGTGNNQTLANATINMTGATITGIAGSNIDFFSGTSALNSLASATTSTISGTQLKIRQTAGLTITTAVGTTASGVDLDISSVIAQDGGFLTAPLKKAGAGTLKLSGANTFTANMEVNAGRLLLTGSVAGTASVGTTGTLAGDGTVTGATTVATTGILSPGNNDVDTLNFGSTLTLDSGSQYAVSITAAATNDKVAVTGALTANGTIKVTLSGYTPVLNDTFDIADAASITGTPTFDFSAATLPSGLAWDTSSFATNGQIKVNTLYGAWAAGFAGFTNNLPAQDHDNDTYVNLLEYAFGTDPTVNSSGPITYSGAAVTGHGQPVLEEVGGVWYAVFGRRTDYVAAGLVYTVEFSNALSAWTATAAVPTTIATDGVIDAVRVPFLNSVPSDSGPQKPTFFRVEVTQP